MNNNLPLVSIVVASYNNGKYLEQCLESAINQTYKNIEIIVADDCSTDNSIEVCHKVINNYPNAKIILICNPKNMGACNSLNNAIFNYCKGDWIKFLDSDDYLSLSCLIDLFDDSSNYANADCIYGKAEILLNGDCIGFHGYSTANYYDIIVKQCINPIPTCGAVIRKSTFISIGGFLKDGYVGDLYLWASVALKKGGFIFINKVVSYYRKMSGNNMMASKGKMYFSHVENYMHLSRCYGTDDFVIGSMKLLASYQYSVLLAKHKNNKFRLFFTLENIKIVLIYLICRK